jgi:hypothetical protein
MEGVNLGEAGQGVCVGKSSGLFYEIEQIEPCKNSPAPLDWSGRDGNGQ